jgi:beta-glucanase (GH16 family)
MITNEKVEYKYGKIAARIKVPEGQGIWPAFWMLGTNISETGGSVDWPYCGEIDIMEKIGGNYEKETTVHGTVHFANENNQYEYQGGSKSISEYLSADYHVYEIEWNADRIIWRLDGEEYHRQDMRASEFNEFEKPFYLLLNVAFGGNWPGYPDSTTEFPQKMYVDWVRVYK